MANEVRLTIAIEVQRSRHDAPFDRLFEDASSHRLPLVVDVFGQGDVDR